MLKRQIEGPNGGESPAPRQVPVIGKITATDPAAKCIAGVAVYDNPEGAGEPELIDCSEIRVFADGQIAVGEASKVVGISGDYATVTMRLVPYIRVRWKHAPCRFCFVWRVPKSVEVQQ